MKKFTAITALLVVFGCNQNVASKVEKANLPGNYIVRDYAVSVEKHSYGCCVRLSKTPGRCIPDTLYHVDYDKDSEKPSFCTIKPNQDTLVLVVVDGDTLNNARGVALGDRR